MLEQTGRRETATSRLCRISTSRVVALFESRITYARTPADSALTREATPPESTISLDSLTPALCRLSPKRVTRRKTKDDDENEFMDALRETLEGFSIKAAHVEMETRGGLWRHRFRANANKARRALAEVRSRGRARFTCRRRATASWKRCWPLQQWGSRRGAPTCTSPSRL